MLVSNNLDLLTWLSGVKLSELQCSEPGWLVQQGMGLSPAPAGMSSQVSACYEIKFLGKYRGFARRQAGLYQYTVQAPGLEGKRTGLGLG